MLFWWLILIYDVGIKKDWQISELGIVLREFTENITWWRLWQQECLIHWLVQFWIGYQRMIELWKVELDWNGWCHVSGLCFQPVLSVYLKLTALSFTHLWHGSVLLMFLLLGDHGSNSRKVRDQANISSIWLLPSGICSYQGDSELIQ